MAGDTFLTLVNRVLTHFNEVNLTTTNFATATGFQAAAKNYVNNSIRTINQAEYEWPFNWFEKIDTMVGSLVMGTYNPISTYPGLIQLATYVEVVDWDSFSVLRDDTIPLTERVLVYIDYDTWVERYKVDDVASIGQTTLGNQIPNKITRPQKDGYYQVSPIPAVNAKVRYEYWGYPSELTLHSDTTTIPTRFNHVIDAGAFAEAYAFRGNVQVSSLYGKKQRDGISKMRELLINRYKKLRDGRVGNKG